MRRTAVLVLCALCAGRAEAADLVIAVTGLSSGAGDVHYGVWDRAEHFPKREGRVAKGHVRAAADGVTITVAGLAPGTYAVAVYHDENGNGEFDQGLFGFPLEDYGFSNDATVFFGPPSFAEAAFALGPGGARVAIRLD